MVALVEVADDGAPLTHRLLEEEATGQCRFSGRSEDGDSAHRFIFHLLRERGQRWRAARWCGRTGDGVARVCEEGDDPGWASWAARPHWLGCNHAGFSENENMLHKGVGRNRRRCEMGCNNAFQLYFQEFEFKTKGFKYYKLNLN
jgi:hypothetical protein